MTKHTRMIQLVDMDANSRPIGHDEHGTEDGERCYVRLPYDVPAYMRAMRLVDVLKQGKSTSSNHVGWTIELDCFTLGVKVFVRIGRDGTLKVITEDSEGKEVVANYTTSEDE